MTGARSFRYRLQGASGVLVDSNILIDIGTNDPTWGSWSSMALAEAAAVTPVVINPIIFAEVSVGYDSIESLNAAFPWSLYRREALPWEAAFLAGKCFKTYRQRGGPRTTPLPDFYIGAHAAVRGLALLTRDPNLYRSYFPRLEVIAP